MNDVQAPGSFKGHFLIAMPGLQDPNFFQTVVLLCEHNEEGALGVVINRVHPTLKAKEIFSELQISCNQQTADNPLYIGGPVHQGGLFILHGPPFGWEGTLAVTETLALSNTLDLLRSLGKREGPERFMIILGCAGWGPGQLDSEILENVWLTTPAEDEVIFMVEAESQWAEAIRGMGIDPVSLSSAAGHA